MSRGMDPLSTSSRESKSDDMSSHPLPPASMIPLRKTKENMLEQHRPQFQAPSLTISRPLAAERLEKGQEHLRKLPGEDGHLHSYSPVSYFLFLYSWQRD